MDEPVLVALLFADRVIEEAQNHKKTIVGTFTFFHAPNYPAVFPPWFIYGAVTNLEPGTKHTFSMTLSHDESNMVIASLGGEFSVPDRSAVAELYAPLANVTFPKSGLYNLTFQIDRKEVGARALIVKQLSQSGG